MSGTGFSVTLITFEGGGGVAGVRGAGGSTPLTRAIAETGTSPSFLTSVTQSVPFGPAVI